MGIPVRQALHLYLKHDIVRWPLPLNTDGLLPQSLPTHPSGLPRNKHIAFQPYRYNSEGRRPVNRGRAEADRPPYDEGRGAAIERYSKPKQEYSQPAYSQQQYSKGWYSDAWSERSNRWYHDAPDQDSGARSKTFSAMSAQPRRLLHRCQTRHHLPLTTEQGVSRVLQQTYPTDPQQTYPTVCVHPRHVLVRCKPELPDWALTNPCRTPRIGLLMDMSLVANHLLRTHLPPAVAEALDAYTALKGTILNDYPNLDWRRGVLITRHTVAYPHSSSHYAHHTGLQCCKDVRTPTQRIDHSFDHVWRVTGRQNQDVLTENEQMIHPILIKYVNCQFNWCWRLTPETWDPRSPPLFPIVPKASFSLWHFVGESRAAAS
eukprot:116972-Amphidinium_carterae.2